MHDPQLLLLDEPTAGVDPKARREFWNEIHVLADAGMTVLVSTHYMDEAERCHRINYISYGRLIAEGTVDEVVARAVLHHPPTSPVPASRPSPGGCARRPASTRWRPSAPRCTWSGAIAAALDAALAAVARRRASRSGRRRRASRTSSSSSWARAEDNMA